MRQEALADLILLAIVFWGVWSLRFLGVENVGAWTVGAAGVVGLLTLRRRGVTLAEVGLRAPTGRDFRLSFEVAGLIGLLSLETPLWIAVFGARETPEFLGAGPQTLEDFMIDLVFFTILATGLGEEFVCRGVLLERFQALFGGGKTAAGAAALAQAVWFGAGHAGQGLAGMAATGTIGLALAIYFLTRARRSLWPLIMAHAAVNTTIVTLTFLASRGG